MKLFKQVAIVGTGLIGGSLALAIQKKKLAAKVIGVSRHKKTLWLAKKMGAVDTAAQDIRVIKDADLVILATPVNTIIKSAKKISKIIKKNCIVTDVGSTKAKIVAKLDKIFSKYIGAHPLAGSEKTGIINASPDIFKDSLCILTPKKNTDAAALKKVKKLWLRLGAKVDYLSPEKHDRILSFTSHLPHALAFSLIAAVPKQYLKFAASGLRDTTRVAASDNNLWADIFLSNRGNLSETIKSFEAKLSEIKSALQKKDRNRLNAILKKARVRRESLKWSSP